MFYPIYLDLHGRPCLVVGGGPIATGKVRGLVEAGALVTVVAPDGGRRHRRLGRERAWWCGIGARSWPSDLDGQFLVYAATDDREVNARIYRLADQANRVANAVDDLDHCNFIAPAVARQGVVQVAISTAGHQPRAGQADPRPRAARRAHAGDGRAGRLPRSWRPEVKRHIDTYERRQALWEGVLEGCVPDLLVDGQQARAADVMQEYLRRAAAPHDPHARCVVHDDRPDVCRACKGV